ncbi:MAG: transporter, partial [Flammeovirgaceae bacterium]|nr:transporter [Flammeovirgaceae bacterium]
MKIKVYFFVAFFLLSGLYSKAQDNARILNLSFEQCIEIALENNLQLKQSQLNLKNQKINLLQSKLTQLPSLNLSGNYGNNWGRSIDPTTNQFTTTESYNSGITGFSQFQIFNGFQVRNSIKKSRND